MALIAKESFDTYSNGALISGLNGGTGWTTAWSSPFSDIITNSSFVSSPNSVDVKSNGLNRNFPYTTTNDTSIKLKLKINTLFNGTNGLMFIQNGGTNVCYLQFNNGGNQVIFGQNGVGGTTFLTNYANGTWYDVEVRLHGIGATAEILFNNVSSGAISVPVTGYANYVGFQVNNTSDSMQVDNLAVFDTFIPGPDPFVPVSADSDSLISFGGI